MAAIVGRDAGASVHTNKSSVDARENLVQDGRGKQQAIGPEKVSGGRSFSLLRRQVGTMTLENLSSHAYRFAQRRMRMDGSTNVRWLAPHLDRQTYFADKIARMRAHDAAAY